MMIRKDLTLASYYQGTRAKTIYGTGAIMDHRSKVKTEKKGGGDILIA